MNAPQMNNAKYFLYLMIVLLICSVTKNLIYGNRAVYQKEENNHLSCFNQAILFLGNIT